MLNLTYRNVFIKSINLSKYEKKINFKVGDVLQIRWTRNCFVK